MPPTNLRYVNFVQTTLAQDVSASDLSFNVSSTSGFPTITGNQYFYAVIQKELTGQYEAVKVTGVSGNQVTVSRAQDDTTALTFETGDTFSLNMTEGALDDFYGDLDAKITAVESTANSANTTAQAAQATANTNATDIDSLETRMDTAEADIDALQADVGTDDGNGDIFTRLAALEASSVAVGAVIPFMGLEANVPTGYLLCDGSEYAIGVSGSTYYALYTALLNDKASPAPMYDDHPSLGAPSDGNFRVPDLRGYFLRGRDGGRGIDPDASTRLTRGDGTTGDAVGTRQNDEVKQHQHDLDHRDDTGTSQLAANRGQGAVTDTLSTGNIPSSYLDSSGAETRPQNIAVNYIIKY